MDYVYLERILKVINNASDVEVVLVKGREKAVFLEPFLPSKIVEEIDMTESLSKQRSYNHYCEIHDYNFRRCALQHIYQYLMYLEKNDKLK